MKSVKLAEIKNKKIFLRVDFNIDLDENGNILSDFRIKAIIPTIEFLMAGQVDKIILASHLGKPKDKEERLSLKPIAKHLEPLLGKNILFINRYDKKIYQLGI